MLISAVAEPFSWLVVYLHHWANDGVALDLVLLLVRCGRTSAATVKGIAAMKALT
jgi:hypothetical protein